jgi:RNA-directed DNA polymerase
MKLKKKQELMEKKTRPFNIPKNLFVAAYKKVKANGGVAGIDQESIADFEKDLQNNLYKLWNRMSSGSYFPPQLRAVPIRKKTGGKRLLKIPTVGDRICQMVAKLVLEPQVEPIFLADSYGYRPNKSALEAIEETRQRCWREDWVLEFDIQGLFDNIPHDLLMKAVSKHTQEKWLILYIERWLKASSEQNNGSRGLRGKGIAQGGVISPVLSNLFLHYVFDKWMEKQHPQKRWCRYADDGLVHCRTEGEAKELQRELEEGFASCGLELHPRKTKIVYCKDGKRKKEYPNKSFEFLGYTFRARRCKNSKDNSVFGGFTPAVSEAAKKSMRMTTKKEKWPKRTELSVVEIARRSNPILRGWLNYYGKYNRSAMYPVLGHFNKTLVRWMMKKYKTLRRGKTRAVLFLEQIAEKNPNLFVHWEMGMVGRFA